MTGASGLVGTWLRRTVPAGVDLVSLVHRTAVAGSACATADLRDADAVRSAFAEVRPTLVIHAAMAVDEASIVRATQHVVDAASDLGAGLLYVSTDAVFSGDGRPVAEDEQPDPVWDYGRWKAQAEQAVLRTGSGSAVVRLPLVVSLDPEDVPVQRVREGARSGQGTTWFEDELRQPAMAPDLADGLWRIASLAPEERSGTWHLVGPELLSRYEIARRAARVLGLDPSTVVSAPTPTGANRPRHLDLRCERARAAIGWEPDPVLA